MTRNTNPFAVQTPETLSAEDIYKLFVDVYSDFPKIKEHCHTFIHGARGTGKSMMLRYLEPKVQCQEIGCDYSELSYYAVHVPIKKANLNISELDRFENSSYRVLAENVLVIYCGYKIIKSLLGLAESQQYDSLGAEDLQILKSIRKLAFDNELALSSEEQGNSISIFSNILAELISQTRAINRYLSKMAFSSDMLSYEDSLLSYGDFLLPLVRLIRQLSFTPAGPVFLLLDDADNLDEGSQRIVNSWVSQRTTEDLCLKISTQLRYLTWRTNQGYLIETPHDYAEVDIKSIYTRAGSSYFEYVRRIVEKRLSLQGAKSKPEEYFPTNPTQDKKLEAVADQIKLAWREGKRVSSRVSDDVTRYKTSEYMRSLQETKKTHLYSYAGFQSLVDISSGAVRYFLEPASRMFSEVVSIKGNDSEDIPDQIPFDIQNQVIKTWSEEYFLADFKNLKNTETADNANDGIFYSQKLFNLIQGMGELFQAKFISDDSERRFISFMITSSPTGDLEKVLDLGVEWGYFQPSTIASKEGIGRRYLYTLNRRLAPYFKIDPSGYAAYMSVTVDALVLAMGHPQRFVRERLKSSNADPTQSDLFSGGG